MTWIRWTQTLAVACCVAACLTGRASGYGDSIFMPPVAANPPVVEPVVYQELLERLQAAEKRIADLESSPAPAGADAPAVAPGRVALTAAVEAPAADPGVAGELVERLEAIEAEWDKFRDAQFEEKTGAGGKPVFKIGGRMQLDYLTFPRASDGIGAFEHPDPSDANYGLDPEDSFYFRRLWLEMQGEFADLMLWRFQVDFSTPNNPQYRDVYLGWRLPYNHTLLVGNQKRPIGLEALNTSQLLLFMERPLSNDAFNDGQRRLGAMMYGFSEDKLFNWRYGVFNLENTAATGRYEGDSLQLGGYGRLAATPWYDETSGGRGYWHVGVSGSVARPDGDVGFGDSNANEAQFRTRPEARTDSRWLDTGAIAGATYFEQVGLETAFNVGSLQLQAEYLATGVQRDDTTRGTGPNVLFHGGYAQAAYFLTGEFVPWDREAGVIARPKPLENFFLIDRCTGGCGHGWGAWQIAARYDYLDLSDGDIRGGIQQNETLGLNWYWNPHAKLQFNLIHGEIGSHRPIKGYTSGDFLIAGTRLAIDF